MQFFKSKKVITVFLAVVIVSAVSIVGLWRYNKGVDVVRASADDNVHGFAWTENYGWISFNSKDCDVNNNGYVDSGDCAGADNNTTPIKDYGVKIDKDTGDMTGYAWNPLLGYICIGSTCQTATNPPADWAPSTSVTVPMVTQVAKYDRASGKITGWANILSFKDDGWIKFDPSPSSGVSINPGSGGLSELSGWAWNGYDEDSDGQADKGIGWISFSSIGCDANGDGDIDNVDCVSMDGDGKTSIYVVTADVNRAPTVGDLGFDDSDRCDASYSVKTPRLTWLFSDPDGDAQNSFKITVNGNVHAVAGFNQFFDVPSSDTSALAYGGTINWSITVYDQSGASSTQVAGSYDIPASEYPKVSFTWYAPDLSAETVSMFNGVTLINGDECDDVDCDWSWVTSDSDDIITSPNASSTMITFAEKGTSDVVTFTATSTADNLSCSTSTTMTVSEKLPDWEEN